MKLSPPIPWSLVPDGAVVLWRDAPRRVLLGPGPNGDAAWLEGLDVPMYVPPGSTTQLVELDEADAIANLAAAGLSPEIIDESTQRTIEE